MNRLAKLLNIPSAAVLTDCAVLAGQEQAHMNMEKEEGMHHHNPVETVNQLVKAVNQGDLEAAVACYEAEAVLIVQPGQAATGTRALRDAFAGYIAMKTTISTETYKIIQASDTVLYSSKWSATAIAPDGTPMKMSGTSSDVLRRQDDGRWLIAIDNPFGAILLNN